MKDDRDAGIIIPFAQNAEFYYQRGTKYLSEEKLERAEQYLRTAYEMEPDRSEYMLSFAETLHRMRMFEESLAVLIVSLNSTEEASGEVLFGIASNFMGLEEFFAAKQCCKACLEKEPDGPYADRALDMLELIEDEPELEAQIGLVQGEDIALLDAIHLAKARHFSVDDDTGINILLGLTDKYPFSEMLDMEIAMMFFTMREYDEAKKRLFNLFKRNSRSVRGNALLALIYHMQKQDTEALMQSKKILIDDECSPEELGYVAPILMELGEYERAELALELLRDSLPYDKEMLHQLAFCYYMHGKKREAEELYDGLYKRNEYDSVAAYYRKHIKEDEEEQFKRDFSINYDVPVHEAIARQRRIRDVATAGVEALQKTWEKDKEFRSILIWSLFSPMSPSLRGTAKMLSLVKDPMAERILRTFLIRFDQTDNDKQFVFGLLLGMEAKPPYSLYYQGSWQYGVVSPVMMPDRLPVSYVSIIELIESFEEYLHENVAYRKIEVPQHLNEVALRVCYYYLSSFAGAKYPHITRDQENAMAAACILMGVGALNAANISPEMICNTYQVSARRLENAIKRILTRLNRKTEEQ